MLSIDRFEGDFAICVDDGANYIKLLRSSIPKNAAEGDVLSLAQNGAYRIDEHETRRRRALLSEQISRLGTQSRRKQIYDILKKSEQQVSASAMAEKFHVSRQIIVGDIALLRASGAPIVATPRGYLLEKKVESTDFTIACRHNDDNDLLDELYTIVDNGATVIDVIVEHPVYGQIVGQLHISSRFDADKFAETLNSSDASPLSQITDGIHLHTIRCHDAQRIERIKSLLKEKCILISD